MSLKTPNMGNPGFEIRMDCEPINALGSSVEIDPVSPVTRNTDPKGGRDCLRVDAGYGGPYAKASTLAGLPTVIAWIASSENPLRRILGTMFSRMWP